MADIELTKDKHILCPASVAAVSVGITVKGLDLWLKNNGLEKVDHKVDLTQILIMRREQAEQQAQDLSDTERKLKAEVKYRSEKAKQEEMVTLRMMGELIPQEEVKDRLENLFLDIRQQLLTIPDNIKTRVYTVSPEIANDCEDVAHDIVQKCLNRLATGNDNEHPQPMGVKPKRSYTKRKTDVPAPTTGNSKRVGRQ